MPIRIRYQNDENQECTIRPTPLASISTNILKNGAGEAFGVNYTITLNGTLIGDLGSPYSFKQDGSRYPFYEPIPGATPTLVGPYGSFDSNRSHYHDAAQDRPPRQQVASEEALDALESKQKALRALFSRDGQRFELSDWNDDEATIICYPRLVDISFEEGLYVDITKYSITLEADTLLDKTLSVDTEGSLIARDGLAREGTKEYQLLASLSGAFVSSFSEDWAIEVDEAMAESVDSPRSYRITHNLSATGKTHYGVDELGDPIKYKAWEQARSFVQNRLSDDLSASYLNVPGLIGSGSLNLIDSYQGYNQIRTENVSASEGTYSVSETYLIASGSAYENYDMSATTSTDSPYVSVSINGSIKGLSQIPASGYNKPGDGLSAYDTALSKYHSVTNNGSFGINSDVYKRVNNAVAVQVNSQPTNTNISMNEHAGTISYALQFDTRPTNIISGVLTENISVTDTYPGDVFAVIPVIGRSTGPIIQYIGGRTEYRRDVSIDLTLDYPKLSYGSNRSSLLLRKPSVVEPTATQLASLLEELSPMNEAGVRKYYLSPPQENWNPKDGSYNLSLSWTYELDK